MGKYKENPRYWIVSVRVNNEDREALEKLSRELNKNVSDLMREALQIMFPQQMSTNATTGESFV